MVADGPFTGVIMFTASTASTALIMRDIAREMTTSGSRFAACYRHWLNKYVDTWDAGVSSSVECVTVK